MKKQNKEFLHIRVKVKVGAKKEELTQKSEGNFLISVKEKAERNMANKRVLEILSEFLKLPKGKIKIVSGHQSPSKLLVIEK